MISIWGDGWTYAALLLLLILLGLSCWRVGRQITAPYRTMVSDDAPRLTTTERRARP